MTLTAPSTAVAAFDKGRLAAGISASDTTITVGPIYKTVNGVRTKQGFDSTSGECIISQGDYQERISFEGSSVNATTKITTLSTCTRGLPVTNTTANFTGGTGRAWPKGAYITVIDSASYNQSTPFKNTANTFTAAQTFNTAAATFALPPILAQGLHSTPFANTTARDAVFTSPTNGDECYVTGTGKQVYTAGAWVTVNATANAIGSTTVAGTFEGATVAEQASHAATGGTGALAVPTTNNLVTLAGDATWISGAIPTLNTSKYLDGSIGGTGVSSPATGSLLIGGGSGSAMTALALGSTGTVPRSNGTTLAMARVPFVAYTNSADSNDISSGGSYTLIDWNTSYTIPAGDLVAGTTYTMWATGITSTTGDLGGKWGIKVGSNVLLFNDASAIAITSAGGTHVWTLRATIICRSTGVSGTIQCSGELDVRTSTGTTIWKNEILVPNSTSTVDTTGTLTFCPQFGWQTDTNTRVSKVKNIYITRL